MTNPNEGKVVSFTNISSQDFTHPYGGAPYFVPAGQTLLFPYHLGKHLAKHLARKMLLSEDKGAQAWDPKDPSMANGNGTVLWNQETENKLIEKILGQSYTHEVPRKKTEEEILREQVAELNKFKDEYLKKNDLKAQTNELASTEGFKDKGQLIAELKALGQTVDARKSKASLEAQLAEAQKAKA